jgi:aspartate/methionine/tyrosine aminotransferase
VVVSTLCNPPKPGEPSHALFAKERADELASLRRRANLVSSAFNSLPNMSVVPTEAAMYSFPQVRLQLYVLGLAALFYVHDSEIPHQPAQHERGAH